MAKHWLGILEQTPSVVQKKRTFARQRQIIIRENMQEFLATGIIKNIDYSTWLVNPVVVCPSIILI